ncbi:MAG: hypothetical protein IPL70_19315 [Uliginosibacterium sp.]|nr:hypothetical protein [Uliginosibacterium sp.]
MPRSVQQEILQSTIAPFWRELPRPRATRAKAVAFLFNPESDSFILSQHRTPAYEKLLARIDAYATEPGNSSTVLDLVREVHHRTEMLSR